MKEVKCVINKGIGRFTRERASLKIDCDLVSGNVDCELVGNGLVHMMYEDFVQDKFLELLTLLANLQAVTEYEVE